MPLRNALSAWCLALSTIAATPSFAQDPGDPLATVVAAKSLCAQDADSDPCLVATRRAVAIVANTVAEAGNTRDRGTFLAPVRILLSDPSPEIRTSAAYALAKLGPDAEDTPLLISLLRDPISDVRAGAWSAARNSSDPTAKLIARRVTEHPASNDYAANGLAFDPAALGFALPDAAEYLWITSDLRKLTPGAQLDFLTAGPGDQTLASFAALSPDAALPVLDFMITDPVVGPAVTGFLDTELYDDPRVISLRPTDTLPQRLIVVYHDRIFGQTGFAIIFADDRSLVPAVQNPAEAVLALDGPFDPAAFDAALLRASGFKPEADPEESDLFMAVIAAGGYGAEGYLEIYPDGAYATEAKAIAGGPRLILDALSYTDTSPFTVSFQNLPAGSSANIQVLDVSADYASVAGQYLPDATTDKAVFDQVMLTAGIFLVTADITPEDGSPTLSLSRDFSVVAGQAALTTDKTAFAPGEPITVRYSGMSGDAQDYVSTAPAGSSNATYLQYAYTAGARDGTLTLTAPTTPGAYELRAFFREDESTLRASLPITVTGATTPPAAPSTPAATPANAGDPAADARATLALNKARFAPGEPITITYAAMFGDRQDYLATTEAGSPNTRYIQYIYTDGAREGTATLTAPTTPGAYELRAFFKEDETILRGSVAFIVATAPPPAASQPAAATQASLTLDKPTYAPGEDIVISFSGMSGDLADYLATAEAGSPNFRNWNNKYTNGAREGTLTLSAPTAPGSYEVRAFFKDDESVLRASVPFAVK